jgi:hypothetical protein
MINKRLSVLGLLNSARGSDRIHEDSMESYDITQRNKEDNASKQSKAIETARESEA